MYYCTSALGAGVSPTPSGSVILWSHWLVVGLVGIIAHVTLAFILTHHIGDYHGTEFSHSSAAAHGQSLWILLFYFLFIASFFFGTNSDIQGVKIVLMVFAAFSLILSVLGYFFPFNKITFLSNNDHHDSGSGLTFKDLSNKHQIESFQRYSFFTFIVASAIINFIIWILSASNNITDKIDFRGENIWYLVTNFLLLIPTIVINVILFYTFKQKGVQIVKKSSGGPNL
jgi:hypothetical protein